MTETRLIMIPDKIRAAIRSEPRLDPRRDHVEVTFEDGVATLEGEVANVAVTVGATETDRRYENPSKSWLAIGALHYGHGMGFHSTCQPTHGRQPRARRRFHNFPWSFSGTQSRQKYGGCGRHKSPRLKYRDRMSVLTLNGNLRSHAKNVLGGLPMVSAAGASRRLRPRPPGVRTGTQ